MRNRCRWRVLWITLESLCLISSMLLFTCFNLRNTKGISARLLTSVEMDKQRMALAKSWRDAWNFAHGLAQFTHFVLLYPATERHKCNFNGQRYSSTFVIFFALSLARKRKKTKEYFKRCTSRGGVLFAFINHSRRFSKTVEVALVKHLVISAPTEWKRTIKSRGHVCLGYKFNRIACANVVVMDDLLMNVQVDRGKTIPVATAHIH